MSVVVKDHGRQRQGGHVVLTGRKHSLRFEIRVILVVIACLLAALATVAVTLVTGSFEVAFNDVLRALAGDADARTTMVVMEWRLPRALLALVLGAALGASGAIFQSLTRNPLGSPDVIGFATGSYTGALVVILIVGGGFYQVAGGALVGGITTAGVVYALSWVGGVHGFRLIIVGIGVSAMLGAANTWMIVRADLDDAMRAALWGNGSLNGLGAEQLLPVVVILAVLLPATALLAPGLRQLELGDDAAMASGVRVGVVSLTATLLGVALTAVATAAAGPIAFVSLVAPQIARRLTKSAGVGIAPAAALGALLLPLADLAAQRLFAPAQLPVGVMTVSIGGIYFVWLLVREARRR